MARIRLVAMDMDGTLLNSDKEVTPATRQAIEQAKARGVQVTFATGRMFSAVVYYARQLGIDVPMINYNGALITDLNRRIWRSCPLDVAAATKVLQIAARHDVYAKAYVRDVLYCDRGWEKSKDFARRFRVAAELVEDVVRIPAKVGPPSMIVIIEEPEVLAVVESSLREELGQAIGITRSRADSLEIIHPQASKGRALLWLARQMGIDPEEILAIGDSHNDLDLLKVAGVAVAMGNAEQVVKDRADFITADCDGDGVAVALGKYVLKDHLDAG
ncbi:MAG: Cof-type HAD-IIB family hydrolase [Limnochordia bacterium]|jgi:Cof subfamily protein (haloacid dehalogenase superfamily)|nr:HAD family phosphatase [Bacillota bacterium]